MIKNQLASRGRIRSGLKIKTVRNAVRIRGMIQWVAYRGSSLVCHSVTYAKVNPSSNTQQKVSGKFVLPPRKFTKVTPSGVKVNLAKKIIFFILLISAQLIHFYCVALIL